MKCTIVHEENTAKSIEESVVIVAIGALTWLLGDLVVGLCFGGPVDVAICF
mgnify:CR=1 FL=1